MKNSTKMAIAVAVTCLAAFLYTNQKFTCASPSAASSGPIINVSISGFSFDPPSIVVGAPNNTSGEFATVIWTNNGGTAHTVTSGNGTLGEPDGLFDSGSLGPGANFTLEVNQTMYDSMMAMYPNGTVPYFCSIHYSFGMVGEITLSTTVVPEFSPSTFLLTMTIILPLLLIAMRSRCVLGRMKR